MKNRKRLAQKLQKKQPLAFKFQPLVFKTQPMQIITLKAAYTVPVKNTLDLCADEFARYQVINRLITPLLEGNIVEIQKDYDEINKVLTYIGTLYVGKK